jgi:hypothetical protein
LFLHPKVRSAKVKPSPSLLVAISLTACVVGCDGERPVPPPAGSTAEKFVGKWAGLIPNTGVGQGLVTGDSYTVEFSHTAPKGEADSAAGLWATITHKSVTTEAGGEILDKAHSPDTDYVFTRRLTIQGLEASGFRSLAGTTYGKPVHFRLDSSNPDVMYYSAEESPQVLEMKRVRE